MIFSHRSVSLAQSHADKRGGRYKAEPGQGSQSCPLLMFTQRAHSTNWFSPGWFDFYHRPCCPALQRTEGGSQCQLGPPHHNHLHLLEARQVAVVSRVDNTLRSAGQCLTPHLTLPGSTIMGLNNEKFYFLFSTIMHCNVV